MNLATSAQLWSASVGTSVTAPIVVDGTVFIGNTNGVLYGFNENTGQ